MLRISYEIRSSIFILIQPSYYIITLPFLVPKNPNNYAIAIIKQFHMPKA